MIHKVPEWQFKLQVMELLVLSQWGVESFVIRKEEQGDELSPREPAGRRAELVGGAFL